MIITGVVLDYWKPRRMTRTGIATIVLLSGGKREKLESPPLLGPERKFPHQKEEEKNTNEGACYCNTIVFFYLNSGFMISKKFYSDT